MRTVCKFDLSLECILSTTEYKSVIDHIGNKSNAFSVNIVALKDTFSEYLNMLCYNSLVLGKLYEDRKIGHVQIIYK